MTINTSRTRSPASHERSAPKPMQVAKASVAVPNGPKPQPAAPSHAAIAEKAYEIWHSLGQVFGRDQEHWFEAERQLRQA